MSAAIFIFNNTLVNWSFVSFITIIIATSSSKINLSKSSLILLCLEILKNSFNFLLFIGSLAILLIRIILILYLLISDEIANLRICSPICAYISWLLNSTSTKYKTGLS